jgi:hypothetical protein
VAHLLGTIPTLRCFVRLEFLHNQDWSYRGEHAEVDIIGIKSTPGRILGFHVLLRNGVMFWDVPIHGLATNCDAQKLHEGRHQAWDCPSADFAVIEFERLRGLHAVVRPLGRRPLKADYHCTIDWTHSDPDRVNAGTTLLPEEHKCGHLLLGDDGNLYLMPNNKLKWVDPDFCVEPFPDRPTYKTNQSEWSVDGRRIVTDDSPDTFTNEEANESG